MTVERGSGRPKGGYIDATNVRVPSVTTILGRCKESGGLVGWAWKMGRDGISLDEARKGTADVGSCVHDRIEAAIQMVDQVTAPMRQINVAIQSAMAPVTALADTERETSGFLTP